MQTNLGYLALVGFVVAVAGFLLALISSGSAGFENRFGGFLGIVGLGVLVLSLILGLLLAGYERLSGQRADEAQSADSDGTEG